MFKFMLFLVVPILLFSQTFQEYKNQQTQNFTTYKYIDSQNFRKFKQKVNKEFELYKQIANKEIKLYKKELSKYWTDTQISNEKKWIEYSPNKKRRKIVDFEKGTIEIQIIAKSSQKVRKELIKEVIKTITESSQSALNKDEISKNIESKFKKIGKLPQVTSKIDSSKPVLFGIFDRRPTAKKIIHFAVNKVKNIKQSVSKIAGEKIYTVKINLPKNFPVKKALSFAHKVHKFSNIYKIDSALIYAIIHSESSFNPLSTSHIPAYGLMQIVPQSAGLDAYFMVYNKKRVLSASYLYNVKNNIELGSAYLHILNYRYLKTIKNPLSRLYCVICAYNTGAGNVARTFIGNNSVRKASKIINRMSPQQVYNKLLYSLPYDETKRYLKKVSKRYRIYQKANI